MIRIALKTAQVRELRSVLRRSDDARLCKRVQAVLMSHRGRSRDDVAADLGLTPRTVQRHLNAWLAGGLDGLRPRKAPGPAPRLSDDLAGTIRGWVLAGPPACGSRLANWTFAALADHLARTRGVRVRKSAMHAFCRRHGVRPYRPTYRYLRGDPVRQAAAARDLAGKKNAPGAAT